MVFVVVLSSCIAILVSFLCSLAESLLLGFNPLALSRLQATSPRPPRALGWSLSYG